MTRAAFALLALTLPAHAAGNAPLADLVPQEWRVSVFEVTCGDFKDCCGVHRECGGWYVRPREPDPAPVPLPWSGLMLAAACGLLWRIRWATEPQTRLSAPTSARPRASGNART